MQDTFRISCGTGCIDRVSRVMEIRSHKTGNRLHMHHRIPVAPVKLRHTAAVFADIRNTLRRIGILNQGPGRPCFPYADHGNDRKNTSGKVYKDKILFADPLLFEPGIDLTGHLVKLCICNSFGMGVIKQNRRIRVLCSIFLQHFHYSNHAFPLFFWTV